MNGAIEASFASRRPMVPNTQGKEIRNTPTAARPVGPHARVSAATTVPHAAGTKRSVSMARSNSAQVAIRPNAMIGSGRVPLLYGSQNVKNTSAAVQWATRLFAISGPSFGRISRESSHHVPSPANSAGRRIHVDAVVTCDINASRS